ncbi:MAG: nucleotide sugar dehydrogenase, partial [Candidatus Geothermarchaeales archaeon]
MRTTLIERMRKRECHVSIIGLGHVGFPLIKLVSERGFKVVGLDVDTEKVDRVSREGIAATTDPGAALNQADCIIICVPTPIDDDYRPDLSIARSVSETIADHLKKGALIVLESTVAPGTTEEVIVPILERSGLGAGKDFFVAHCPERIDPGNTKWTVRNIPRVVGGINNESTDIAYAFYRELLDAEIIKVSTVKTAEAVKIVENAFRDINIAFVNELAKSFDKIGIDVTEVIKGASTKPFGFMPHYPGCGVGGQCIAVDPYYLIERAGKSGFNHRFLKLAREIN